MIGADIDIVVTSNDVEHWDTQPRWVLRPKKKTEKKCLVGDAIGDND